MLTTAMSVLRRNAERMTFSDLKQFLDKTVTLRMTEGEIAKVRVLVVDEKSEQQIRHIQGVNECNRLFASVGFFGQEHR